MLMVFVWNTVYNKQKGTKGYEDPATLIAIFELKADGTRKYQKPIHSRPWPAWPSPRPLSQVRR